MRNSSKSNIWVLFGCLCKPKAVNHKSFPSFSLFSSSTMFPFNGFSTTTSVFLYYLWLVLGLLVLVLVLMLVLVLGLVLVQAGESPPSLSLPLSNSLLLDPHHSRCLP